MSTPNRDDLRRFYVTAWHKAQAREPLEPLEELVASVISEHPEYQAMLETFETALTVDDQDGTNPFLHLSLHLALREQLMTDRPAGIRALYQSIRAEAVDTHTAEHRIIDCLADTLWSAQRDGLAPDEQAYMDCVSKLIGRRGPLN